MKNIYVLPTDKPSRLYKVNNKLYFEEYPDKVVNAGNQHIYITSDEEIKEWFIVNGTNGYSLPMKYSVMFPKDKFPNGHDKNKLSLLSIILTTDQDLIKDGVQAIDDEFLEWFVKNPSCEEIEVEKYFHEVGDNYDYEIIIPKEEPKQETLEEAKLRQLFKNRSNCYADTGRFENDGSYFEGEVIQAMDEDCFIKVIKEWQAERMHSEEEVLVILDKFLTAMIKGEKTGLLEKWFEQFKKK